MCEDCTDTYISNCEEGDCILHDNFSYDDYQVRVVMYEPIFEVRDTFYRPLNVGIRDFEKIGKVHTNEGDIKQNDEKVVENEKPSLGANVISKKEEMSPLDKYNLFAQYLDPNNIRNRVGISFDDTVELFSKIYDATESLRQNKKFLYLKTNLLEYVLEALNNISTISNNTLINPELECKVRCQLNSMNFLDKQRYNRQINEMMISCFNTTKLYNKSYSLDFEYYKIMCLVNYDCTML